jgi:hypothetical protein
MNSIIRILPTGEIVGIKTDVIKSLPLDEFGQAVTRRASHIQPCHPGKRLTFRLLRAAFGERGRIAGWCRAWRGPWQVTWANAPARVVFSHPSRRVCIQWEITQLNERLSRETRNFD